MDVIAIDLLDDGHRSSARSWPRPNVVSVVTSADELRHLLPAWRALADRVGAGGAFGLPSVAAPWFEHLGRGSLHVVTVHRGSELVAVAPLHHRRIAGREVVRWLGHGLGVVGDVVCRPGDPSLAAIWRHLAFEGLTLDLTSFRHGGRGLDELRRSRALEVRRTLSGMCPVVDLRRQTTFDTWAAHHPGLAKSLRRLDKKVHVAGIAFDAEVVTTRERVIELLPELRRLSAAADAHHPRLDVFAGRWRPFTEAMLTQLARDGALVLVIGRLDGAVAAFDVCVRSGPTLYDIYGRFDPAFAEWSPGTLTQRAVVETALAAGLAEVDLQLGDDAYKRRWCDASYDAVDVLGAPAGRLDRAARWHEAVLGAHRVKQVAVARLRQVRTAASPSA